MGGLCLAWKLTRPRLTYDRFKLIEANTVRTREIDPDSVLGRGYRGGGRGRLYTYRYTVTTRMIPALRWAALRAILMSH